MSVFVAIDFETADQGRDSACSVGLVRVEHGVITRKEVQLIRPPRLEGGDLFTPAPADFMFTYIHGIKPEQVLDAPTFGQAWPKLAPILKGVEFMAAHNAPFDSGVLNACCEAAGLPKPAHRFVCTVRLARSTWSIYPTKLNNVCQHLNIQLNHHEALSDALACAQIVIAAEKKGVRI
ncbi:MAG: 3'-5' exonuclease [Elusimicrobia bacterium]|nr:3'-5' exonuclease [Elusimicrobiota bacterium]